MQVSDYVGVSRLLARKLGEFDKLGPAASNKFIKKKLLGTVFSSSQNAQ